MAQMTCRGTKCDGQGKAEYCEYCLEVRRLEIVGALVKKANTESSEKAIAGAYLVAAALVSAALEEKP